MNNLAGVFTKRCRHGRSSLFCVLGRMYMCDRKNGKGSGREGSGTGSEGSERGRTRTSSIVGPSGTPSHAMNEASAQIRNDHIFVYSEIQSRGPLATNLTYRRGLEGRSGNHAEVFSHGKLFVVIKKRKLLIRRQR